MSKGFKLALAVVALSLTAATAAYAAADRSTASDTLVFGASSDPTNLDGALVSDGESLRVITQMMEGLVTLRPGTTKIAAQLATSWRSSNKGKMWVFNLRSGVKFHDGTAFNAAAVCFNFDRWYNFPGPLQSSSASYYYSTFFGGFAKPVGKNPGPALALYKNCRANSPTRVTINLRKPNGAFLGALSLQSFAIQSPTALKQYGADQGKLSADGVFTPTGTYSFSHPTGTGPFKFESWKIGDKLVLVRNDEYWGRKAVLKTLIFRAISDNAARLQALQTGEIQGYDNVEPQDIPTVKRSSKLKIIDRPAFNVGYVTINRAVKPFDNLKVRQAVAHGLDRAAVVKSFYAGRGVVAHQFMPPEVLGYAKNVQKYSYNPAKAKALLQQAGLTLPVEVEFWYPTDVSRPYMPDPQRNFQAFAASLEKSGFKVIPKSAPWSPDYLGKQQAGTAGALNLIGWTGDYGDADNFVGTFFRTEQKAWGPLNKKIANLLNAALAQPDADRRIALYQQANREIAKFIPGVPYVHTKPALAFLRNVTGYKASPVSLESFVNTRVG